MDFFDITLHNGHIICKLGLKKMNSIDIAIIVILGLSCLMGIVRGFTREILGLFTWLGAAGAAYLAYPSFSGIARGHIANPVIADTITGILLFIVFLVIFSIITFHLANAIRDSVVGSVDRGLGLVFGVFRGALFICAIEVVFSLFIPRETQSEKVQTAQFVPMVRRGADELVMMLPANVRQMIDQQTNKVQKGVGTTEQKSTQLLPTLNPEHQRKQAIKPHSETNEDQSDEKSLSIAPGKNGSMGPHGGAQHPGQGGKSNRQPVDPEKMMESLSQLHPQASESKGNDGVIDKRQQRELDRLIETSE